MERFVASHRKHSPVPVAIGGHFTFHITPTSIGTVIEIECNACGKKKDATDYESW